jgi:membrane protein implicated in regulation of membrane protease activity
MPFLPFSITNNTLLDITIIIFIILLAVFIALKIFEYFLKGFFVGIIFAMLPFAARVMGFDVAINLQSILWFLFTGMTLFFVYHSISIALKTTRFVISPFRKLFEKKEKKKVVKVKRDD